MGFITAEGKALIWGAECSVKSMMDSEAWLSSYSMALYALVSSFAKGMWLLYLPLRVKVVKCICLCKALRTVIIGNDSNNK